MAGDFGVAGSEVRSRIARLRTDGTVDSSFGKGLAGANDRVQSVAIQDDGKVLLGGNFTRVNNQVRDKIARLNADGSLDTNFVTSVNGPVYSIAIQPDGKILLGGNFFYVNGTVRISYARLNNNGSLDHSFTNMFFDLPGTPDVYSVALQNDGKVFIGGNFMTNNGAPRNAIARLNSNGTLDSSFGTGSSGPNSYVRHIVPLENGNVFISGVFFTVDGVARKQIARLNENGTLDTSFGAGFEGGNATVAVYDMAKAMDGKILVCGQFTPIGGFPCSVARLDANGIVDPGFQNAIADEVISRITLEAGGKVLLCGSFRNINSIERNCIARLNSDGSFDNQFPSGRQGPSYWVYDTAIQSSGKLLVAASFSAINGGTYKSLARLNADGSRDESFVETEVSGGGIKRLVIQDDDKIVIAGNFSFVNGIFRNYIARLHANGSLDTSFGGTNVVSISIDDMAIQSDEKIVLVGSGSYGSARLNTNGTRDNSFVASNSYANGVNCVAVDNNNKVLIGGSFSSVGTVTRKGIARLNTNGSVDLSFGNEMNAASVNCIAVQNDNKVLVGGLYIQVNGLVRNGIARLNEDGSFDTSFGQGMSGANSYVMDIAIQQDGKIIIGGRFSGVNFVPRDRIARLNPDGSVDTTFVGNSVEGPNEYWRDVFSISIGLDDKVYAGGTFTAINGFGRRYLASFYGDRPPLGIRAVSHTERRLFWPSGWPGFTLQEKSELESSWADSEQTPANDGTNWFINYSSTNSKAFFRVKK